MSLVGFLALLLSYPGVGLIILYWTQPVSCDAVFKAPLLQYDINSASIWKCFHNLDSVELYDKLHRNGHMEVIHSRTNSWVQIISPAEDDADFLAMGLHSCTKRSQMSELIEKELKQNWDSLQYHISKDARVKYHNLTSELIRKHESDGIRRVLRNTDSITGGKTSAFDHYLNLSSIYDWYEKLAHTYPSLVTLHRSIGKTYYMRDIYAVHVTDKSSGDVKEKSKIYIQCLLHAREWISGPICMYIAERLVKDTLFLGLLQQVEIVIVPVANPDGYYVTWYKYPIYRLWRKNVRPIKGTECAGVDLNRNFDSHWNMHSSSQSDDPCTNLFRGKAANSELETQAITSYFKSLGPSIIGAIDFHSYHQEVLYPPAWGDHNPDDIEDIERVARSVATAVTAVGVPYTARRMIDVYAASGTFADWLLDQRESGDSCHSMIPLTVELRPKFDEDADTVTQAKGFMLPASEIYPSCVETLVAFLEFVERTLETGRNC